MKDGYSSSISKKENEVLRSQSFVSDYIWAPIRSGIYGFAMFFIILLAVKFLSYLIGTYTIFTIELTDLSLSSIGFVLLFLIRELENFKEKEA